MYYIATHAGYALKEARTVKLLHYVYKILFAKNRAWVFLQPVAAMVFKGALSSYGIHAPPF